LYRFTGIIKSMKFQRIVFLLALTSIFSAWTNAQSLSPADNPLFNGERKFTGGLVAGGNACQVDGDYLNGYHKFGINAGAVAYVNFSSKIAASLELLYSQKGSYSVTTSESPYVGTYFAKYSIHLNYVEMPLVFHYHILPRYFIGVGASYNVLVNSKEEYNEATYSVVIDPELYPFNKSSVDMLFSGNIALWRGLMLNIRYQYSLTPIRQLKNIPTGLGFQNQQNNLFAFRLMYLF
jgi:hypothetical protein